MLQFSPLGTISHDQMWFMKRNPIDVKTGVKGIVAHDGPVIKGMAVFDTWTENSCQVHIVITHPTIIRHGFIDEGFKYVFETCGRGIIYGLTPENNEKALKFNEHVGFVELYPCPGAGYGGWVAVFDRYLPAGLG